jgi:hypothetical protein
MKSEESRTDSGTSESPPACLDGTPDKKPFKVIVNNLYKWLLVGMLAVGLMSNLYSFFASRTPLSVIGFFFQMTVLVSLFEKWKYQELLVKIWSGLFIIIGIAIVVMTTTLHVMYQMHRYDDGSIPGGSVHPEALIISLPFLAIGLYFFLRFKYNCEESA